MRWALSLVISVLASQASAAEWWHGDFAWDESTHLCEDNDSRASYGEKQASFWEQDCKYTKVTPLKGMDGVILDMTCFGEGEDLGSRRELLLKMDGGKIASFPPYHLLKPCSEFGKPPPEECPFNSSVYRSPLFGDARADSYQELQFLEGLTGGPTALTEFRGGKPVWRSTGEFGCSNGASICRLSFPVMYGEPQDFPFELVDVEGTPQGIVVIPAFSQSIYQNGKYATINDKPYGGLVADLLGGYAPKEDELVMPNNIYRFAECRR